MAVEGPGALSLAEVARRVGMRPPSLYQYFPSKVAVYDERFAGAAGDLHSALVDAADKARAVAKATPLDALRAGITAFVGWSVTHPVQAQILFWRPVPGFVPSARSYQAALRTA